MQQTQTRKRTLSNLSQDSPDTQAQGSPSKKPQVVCSAGTVLVFKTPGNDCKLVVSRVHTSVSQQDLEELFGSVGLLYDLRLYCVESEEKPYNFAFVKYYSCWSALEAQKKFNGHKFCDVPIWVGFAKERNDKFKDMKPLPLTIQRSIEVCNYYMGFDGWSSHLVTLAPAEPLSTNPETGLLRAVYKCVVRLSFKKDDRMLTAIGFGLEEAKQRGQVIEFAKKKAVTEAYKNAFASMALVLLRSGKVAIHFLDTHPDSWEGPQIEEKGYVGAFNI